MGTVSGVKVTQNTGNQKAKAEALEALVQRIVNKIEEIDSEITSLVQGGLEGNSVQTMANTYIHNREVVNDYIKRFALTAEVLYDTADLMQKNEDEANAAASGTSV